MRWGAPVRRGTAAGFAVAALVALGGLLVPDGLEAQARGYGRAVPPGHMPPPGECRVWYDDLPPGHQPSPTSCGAASREAYRTGGRVVYGGARGRDERWRDERWRDGRPDRDRRECDGKDRRKGECDYGRYPGGGYPEGRYPDRGDRLPDIWDIILDRPRR